VVATLSFEGESHAEIVIKVKRWLQSVEGGEADTQLTPAEAVERGAELTKDALRVVAAAAPGRIGSSDVVKSLTSMGYKATDQTRDAVVASLDSIEELTGGSVLKKVEGAGRTIVWEMNSLVAKQLLKALTGGSR
jgi:hypothetical protein